MESRAAQEAALSSRRHRRRRRPRMGTGLAAICGSDRFERKRRDYESLFASNAVVAGPMRSELTLTTANAIVGNHWRRSDTGCRH